MNDSLTVFLRTNIHCRWLDQSLNGWFYFLINVAFNQQQVSRDQKRKKKSKNQTWYTTQEPIKAVGESGVGKVRNMIFGRHFKIVEVIPFK